MKALVLEVRGLHVGHLGCYGNEWVATPTLDRLASGGVVFDRHYADCPGAMVRTAWTGRYHFPFPGGEETSDVDAAAKLSKLLGAHGVRFELLAAPHPAELEALLFGVPVALEKLAADEHGLIWVDLPTLAPPWQVPEDYLRHYFAEQPDDEEPLTPWLDPPTGPFDPADDTLYLSLQNTYAAAVTYLDAQLGLLLEELWRRDLTDRLLLLFTAGHGLALGEHGVIGDCQPSPYEELIHLPLIIRLPGGAGAGRRIGALTQPVDLLPTLLEEFSLPAPTAVHGHSLRPLMHGGAERVRAYACTGLQQGGAVEWALRTPAWGFILTVPCAKDEPPRQPQLYVKPDDRWEVNNVVQHYLELAEHMEQTLRAFVAATEKPGPLKAPELRDVEAEPAAAPPEEEANPTSPI
jgi:arylsulfatase A-like enzyme